MPTIQETIDKLSAKSAAARERMTAALTAATADGVTDEDKAKHFAAFDAAEKERDDAEKDLARAVKVRDAEASAVAFQQREREPATAAIASRPFVPGNAAPTAARPAAVPRRVGPLRAFHGPNADLEAYQAGLFVAGHFLGHAPSRQRLENDFGIQATLSTIDNTRGGYFVPDVMDNAILRLLEDYGTVRRLATMVPMSSDTWSKPRLTGGVTAYWVAEGSAPAQSTPTWDRVQLVAKNLAAYDKITNQLNEDAVINLADEWAVLAANKFAYEEDNAAFNGDGTSTYGGITGLLTKVIASANSASLVTATGHTTLGALTKGDFESVIGKKPRYPGFSPRWFMSQDVYAASVMGLNNAMGGNTRRDISGRIMETFLDYPVEIVNAMPAAASVTSGVTGILFADLAVSTLFGDRRQRAMRVTEINDDAIKQMQTLFMAERVDILNHTIIDPVTSTKAGPVIGLKLG